MENTSFLKDLKNYIPYLILFLITCFGLYILFYNGMPAGDDTIFHFGQIYDIYYGFENGLAFSKSNHIILSFLGYNARIFYAPLSHYLVVIVALILKPLGVPLIVAYKFVLLMTTYLSGIVMYKLIFRMTKNKVAALIGAVIFLIYPYRIFAALCRSAFAEALAASFVPIIFLGIYDVINEEKVSSKSFAITIIGVTLTLLTHNITAVYAALFAGIYIVFNIHKIIKKLKYKEFVFYAIVSVILILGLSSFYLVGVFENLADGLYQVSSDEAMGTIASRVASETYRAGSYSGFLNLPYIAGMSKEYESLANINHSLVVLGILSIIFIIADLIKFKSDKFKNIFQLCVTIILIIMGVFVVGRIETYMTFLIFIILYYFMKKIKITKNKKKFYKDLNLYYVIVMLALVYFLIHNPDIWYNAPSFLRKIQFPWRLWAFFQMYVALFVGIVFSYVTSRFLKATIIFGSSIFLALNQGTMEKRVNYNIALKQEDKSDMDLWHYDIDIRYSLLGPAAGWQREYCPKIIFAEYSSTNRNSLLNKMRVLTYKTSFNLETYKPITPVLLEGEGTISIVEVNTPKMIYQLDVTTNGATIHVPLYYYKGYEIKLITDEKTLYVTPYEFDGILTFNAPKGSYRVEINYIGTKNMQLADYISIGCVVLFISWQLTSVIISKKKKEMLIDESQNNA